MSYTKIPNDLEEVEVTPKYQPSVDSPTTSTSIPIPNTSIPRDIDSVTRDIGSVPVNGSINTTPMSERTLLERLKESSHPIALFCYIFFRLAPIFVYLFGNLALMIVLDDGRFILHFIVLILLVSADFWNVKNISGRLLVGLRWWNETSGKDDLDEFENIWVFETANPDRYINPIDSKVFWILLYVQPVLWIVLAITALLKLELLYFFLICICLSLSLTNAMAFTNCDKFGKANTVANDLFSRATSGLLSRLNPFA